MNDQEREDLISYCGKCLQEAMDKDDKSMAYFWLEAQSRQIQLRSPQQVQRMEQDRGIA